MRGGQLAGLRTFQFSPDDGDERLAIAVYDLRRTDPFLSLDGIRLLDPAHNKVYRAVQDAQQNVWS